MSARPILFSASYLTISVMCCDSSMWCSCESCWWCCIWPSGLELIFMPRTLGVTENDDNGTSTECCCEWNFCIILPSMSCCCWWCCTWTSSWMRSVDVEMFAEPDPVDVLRNRFRRVAGDMQEGEGVRRTWYCCCCWSCCWDSELPHIDSTPPIDWLPSVWSLDLLSDFVTDAASGISASPLIFNISAVFRICGNCSVETLTSPKTRQLIAISSSWSRSYSP